MKIKTLKLFYSTPAAICALALFAPSIRAADKDTLDETDVNFVKHESAAGDAAVKMGELGAKKATRPEVRAFAEMMAADHTKANGELKALAATKGVEISQVTDPKHAEAFQKLEKSSAADFDNDFLKAAVGGHQKCVGNFEEASMNANDTDVKAFATKTLPILRVHLARAKELAPKGVTSEGTTKTTAEPDNTARNSRDRDAKTLTPLDQGSSKSDVEITAQIRKEIIATADMSVNAQNVKIITQNGKVTLRGPVNTASEKTTIDGIATRLVRTENVASHLEVK